MKIDRNKALAIANSIVLQDQLGAVYTADACSTFTKLDMFVTEVAEANVAYRQKALKKAAPLLGIETVPQDESQLSEDDQKKFQAYMKEDQEYTKWLADKVEIPVKPLKLADLKGCKLVPTLLRPLHGTFITKD